MAHHRADAPLTAAAVYLLPLAAAPDRLLHPGPWLGFLAAIVTLRSQPRLSLREMMGAGGPDRWSALAIFVAMIWVQLAAVLDFGYVASSERGRPLDAAGIWVGLDLVEVLDFGYGTSSERGGPLDGAGTWVGLGLVIGGLALRLSAIRTLGRWFTSIVRVERDQRVVRTGVYRLIRHPSYTGALLAALGVACALGSALGAALVLLVAVPAYLYRMATEERSLLATLGDEYASYRAATWRLIPFVY